MRRSGIPSRRELRKYVASSECYIRAEALAHDYPHLEYDAGFFIMDDGRGADHAWVVAPDDTIIDTTHQQFDPKIKILIAPPGSPQHSRFISYKEHHNPDYILEKYGVDERCQFPGCTYDGTRRMNPGHRPRTVIGHAIRHTLRQWHRAAKRGEPGEIAPYRAFDEFHGQYVENRDIDLYAETICRGWCAPFAEAVYAELAATAPEVAANVTLRGMDLQKHGDIVVAYDAKRRRHYDHVWLKLRTPDKPPLHFDSMHPKGLLNWEELTTNNFLLYEADDAYRLRY